MNLIYFTNKVKNGEHLSRVEMNEAATHLFNNLSDQKAITDFLVALHGKSETAEEIVGLVDVVMKHRLPFDVADSGFFDNCGTGGDKLNTFNISTTTAFVLAGAGLKIAKHGNRKISSQSGSSDVLEILGIPLMAPLYTVKEQLQIYNIAFLHAPNFHPLLGKLREIRSAIPHATIFNMIGPLCNPVSIDTQLVGINNHEMIETYAKALLLLGRKRAIVLSGDKGLDEASLSGTTHYALLENDSISTHTLTAEDIRLPSAPLEAIKGGTAQENATILLNILHGKKSVYRDTVLLNAAFALLASGKTTSLEDGIVLAKESIDSGKALAKLHAVQQFNKKVGIAQ